MIVIFTDYGLNGPYLGQIVSDLYQQTPGQPVVTLLADAPRYNPRASAYLLSAFTRDFPADTVFFSVIDPGVGSYVDKPIIMKSDGRWYVGPDNGLFDMVARTSHDLQTWEISWQPGHLSNTFHGRDLYAPVCGMLANKQTPPGNIIKWVDQRNWPDDLHEIIYIDRFGNAMTGIRAGQIDSSTILEVNGHSLSGAGKFSDMKPEQGFWYENSYGLVEIAVNKGSAKKLLGIAIEDIVSNRQ